MAYLGNRPATGENNSFRLLDDISSHVVTFNGSSSSIVSISDDTIAFTGAEHRFITGQKVTYSKGSGGTVITGLTDATAYYIIKDSSTKIKLATSESNANSGVAINLTGVGGGSAHKITLAFDGFNTKFKSSYLSGTQEPIITRAAQLVISLNGVIQQPVDSSTPSVGFGIDNVGNIIFSTAPAATDSFWGNIHSSNTVTFDISDNDIDNFTGDGSTKEFTLSKIPPDNRNVLVTLDGVVQYPDDNSNARSYKLSENILEFIAAPGNGVAIQVRHIGFAGGSSGSGGGGGVTGFYGRTGNVVLKNTDNILVNNATFSGNVSIAKTLTYMDVTNIDAVGIVTFQDDVQYNGSGAGISSAFWDKSANEFKFKDNVTLSLGDGQDLKLLHNGSNSVINNTTGSLLFQNNGTSSAWINNSGVIYTNNDILFQGASSNVVWDKSEDYFTFPDKIAVHTGDSNTAIRFPGNDTFQVETDGSARLKITDGDLTMLDYPAGDKVGIGTNVLVAKLDVKNNSNIPVIKLNDSHYNKYLTIRGGGTPNRMVIDAYEGSGGGADIDLASNGSTKVRIKSTGYVGINTTGLYPLDVWEPTDNAGWISISGENTGYDTGYLIRNGTTPKWFLLNDVNGTGSHTFEIRGDGNASDRFFTLTQAGNVGINKASPNIGSHNIALTISNLASGARTAIEVEGNTTNCHGAIDFRSNGTLISAINSRGSDQLQLCTGTSGTVRAEITSTGVYVGGSAAGHTAGTLWFNDTTAYASKIAQVNGSSALSFHTGQNQPEQMRLDSNGNLGIGTTAPNHYNGYGTVTLHGTSGGELDFERNSTLIADIFSNSTGMFITNREANKPIILRTNQAGIGVVEAIKIDASGHVLFRGDSGSDNYRMQLRVSSTQNQFFGSANSSTNKGYKFYSSNTSGSCKFVIANDGKLGVGVTVPAQLLHIQENSSNGSFMVFTNDTTGVGGNDGCLFGINSDEGGTIWQQENNYIRFGTNDTPRLIIKASGKTEFYEEIETPQDYPDFRPTLDFNFAAVKKLDPRIVYYRTGPASYTDEFGKVVIVGESQPRFDHSFPEFWDEGTLGDSNSKGVSKGLLIEDARTNIFKDNHNLKTVNDHSSLSWTTNTTETTAPDGTYTATKITGGASGSWSRFDNSNGLDVSTINFSDTFTYSVYMKTVGTSNVDVNIDYGDQGSKLFSVGQEWKRYAISSVHHDYGNTKFIDLDPRGDIYIWGLQVEKGTFPTSYIPTRGTTVTRGADYVGIKDIGGPDHADFWNTEEGSYIIDYEPLEIAVGNGVIIGSKRGNNGSGYPWPLYRHDTANTNNFKSYDLTNSIVAITQTWAYQRETWGLTFNGTNGSITRNGTLVQTDNTSMNGLIDANELWLGSSGTGSTYSMHVRRFMYYPKRLPNSQLVTLTA